MSLGILALAGRILLLGVERILVQHFTPSSIRPVFNDRKTKPKFKTGNREIVIAKEFKGTDPILPLNKLNEAKEMATLYPLLYVLENSIRELIDIIMISRYGNDWWQTDGPRKLKPKAQDRMADENKHSWHQRRGARPIDYLDLYELPRVLKKVSSSVVPDIIPSFEWFNQLVEEVYKSRCVLCHMNPLDQDSVQGLKLRFNQWQKQINQKKDKFP